MWPILSVEVAGFGRADGLVVALWQSCSVVNFSHAFGKQNWNFSTISTYLNDQVSFDRLLRSCYEKVWIISSKPPFRSAETVVEYLGRYTHRVAISNNRIIAIQDGKVTFSTGRITKTETAGK